jgi:hypothetical protein
MDTSLPNGAFCCKASTSIESCLDYPQHPLFVCMMARRAAELGFVFFPLSLLVRLTVSGRIVDL